MMHRLIWLLPLGLIVVALFVLEPRSGGPPGCETPPREEKVLDRYEKDRALATRPPGARGGEPERIEGCTGQSFEDMTVTSVVRRWFGPRQYSEAELRDLYQHSGWAPVSVPVTTDQRLLAYLRLCRIVEDVVSYLDVAMLNAAGDPAAGGDPFEVRAVITAYLLPRSCPG